ncbi:MAG: hypothetical protein D6805_09720 [Planctomycetota bacterium]|nr:MAG: hypothetical protein D6805_09720 [Planctomycetota bacterium]
MLFWCNIFRFWFGFTGCFCGGVGGWGILFILPLFFSKGKSLECLVGLILKVSLTGVEFWLKFRYCFNFEYW